MDDASKLALLTGFGGVLFGGVITYLSETQFRRQERKAIIRKDFQLCLCEVGRVMDELFSIYNSSVAALPEEQPPLISTMIRHFASLSATPISLDTEKLFSVNHDKDEIFTDVSLFFRRFNASIDTFKALNVKKTEVAARWLQEGISAPTGDQDIASVRIDGQDGQTIAELVTLENLHRNIFRNLIEDIRNGRNIIERLNANSERKFKSIFRKKFPKLDMIQEFTPLAYLENMPYFSISDLPAEAV